MSAPALPAMSAPALPLQPSVTAVSACWHQRFETCRQHLASLSGDGSNEPQLTTHIHEARKELKGLRALSRLLRDTLCERRYHLLNSAFRDAARELSVLRRQAALHECLAKLCNTGQLDHQSFERLSTWLDPIPSSEPFAAEQASRALELLLSIPTDLPGDASVEGQLRRQFECARRSYLRVVDITQAVDALLQTSTLVQPTDLPEALHEWRKQVKHHTLQMRAACPTSSRLPQLKQLGSSLGDAHDLDDLRRHIQQHRAFGEVAIWKHRMLALITARELELTLAALALGAHLFAETSGDLLVHP